VNRSSKSIRRVDATDWVRKMRTASNRTGVEIGPYHPAWPMRQLGLRGVRRGASTEC
jgi:hypothetical protein